MDRRCFVIGAGATALAARPAFTQGAFPSHAITIVNAFPPGGLNDIVTRPLATAMEPILKRPVVVETKAGAAGQVGAQFVASAKPDGYTLLSHNTGISGYAEVDKLFGRPAKVTRADFIPLARVVADPMLLLVNEAQPYKTLNEFIAGAEAHPDTLVFSSGGLYGASHLPLAYLEKAAAYQSGEAAPARHLRRDAFEVAARCADAEGARLRRGILSLGRHIRAERHAGRDRDNIARSDRQGGAFRRIYRRARQCRAGARVSRRSRLPDVLGRGRAANRRGGDLDRTARINFRQF